MHITCTTSARTALMLLSFVQWLPEYALGKSHVFCSWRKCSSLSCTPLILLYCGGKVFVGCGVFEGVQVAMLRLHAHPGSQPCMCRLHRDKEAGLVAR